MKEIEIKKTNKLINYESSVNFMKSRINEIHNNTKNELLWFLNYNHTYTQGTSATSNEILKNTEVNVIKTNRGGRTTYHGPGQRIVYLMINLNNRKKDIRRFISTIESSLITLLKDYKIESKSFKDRVGIWVTGSEKCKFDKEMKIGAIGLRVSKWITYHGLSFNINPDLKYYNNIIPCGIKNYKNTSLKELGINITNDEFDEKFKNIFLEKIAKI